MSSRERYGRDTHSTSATVGGSPGINPPAVTIESIQTTATAAGTEPSGDTDSGGREVGADAPGGQAAGGLLYSKRIQAAVCTGEGNVRYVVEGSEQLEATQGRATRGQRKDMQLEEGDARTCTRLAWADSIEQEGAKVEVRAGEGGSSDWRWQDVHILATATVARERHSDSVGTSTVIVLGAQRPMPAPHPHPACHAAGA